MCALWLLFVTACSWGLAGADQPCSRCRRVGLRCPVDCKCIEALNSWAPRGIARCQMNTVTVFTCRILCEWCIYTASSWRIATERVSLNPPDQLIKSQLTSVCLCRSFSLHLLQFRSSHLFQATEGCFYSMSPNGISQELSWPQPVTLLTAAA